MTEQSQAQHIPTLRKIASHPGFRDGVSVKISRNSVRATVAFCSLAGRRDGALRWAFDALAAALPPAPSDYVQARVSEWTHA